jgi:hypothetical protein
MEAGITDPVRGIEDLMTRSLSAEPYATREPNPLAPPPGNAPTPAKELPFGRDWLRLVQGGKSARMEVTKKPTPPPTPTSVVARPIVKRWEQLDPLSWRLNELQLVRLRD